MKTNNSMIPVDGDAGTLRTAYYATLARYYVKFLQAYVAAGVRVWGVTPQNEPSVTPGGYPGMSLSASQERMFISGSLAPALAGAGLGTKILGADDNPNIRYAEELLADPTVNDALYAMAYHCYGGNIQDIATINAAYPKRSYLTECSPPPGIAPMSTPQLVIDSTNAGVSGVNLWNLALNPGGGPKIGAGCADCDGLIAVNPDGTVAYQPGFYQLGQFSRFVRSGAVHIGSDAPSTDGRTSVSATAFRNPDGSEVLVANNNDTTDRTVTVSWNRQGSFRYTVPANTTVTFTTAAVPALIPPPAAAKTVFYTTTGTGLGQWDFQPADAWSRGDGNAYSNRAGATATLRFTGTGITVYAFPNVLNGVVSVAVDGGKPRLVDLSADPSRTPAVKASFGGLDPAVPHTLVETVTGTTGSAERGTYGSVISAVTAADTVGPQVSLGAVPARPDGRHGRYVTPVTVTATVIDNTDPGPRLEARIDSAPAWTPLDGPVTFAANGSHSLWVRAVDAAGNVSATATFTAAIDKADTTPPVSNATADPATRTVTLRAADNASGVSRIEYRTPSGAWTTARGPVAVGRGRTALGYRAVDRAGNVEVTNAVIVEAGW